MTITTNQLTRRLQIPTTGTKKDTIELDKATITKCRKLLKTKQLLQNINKYIGLSGIIGEENNRLLLFIIASSYKMQHTLHGLIQGSSGSGKTRLLKTISQLMPSEDVKHYTRVTENSFYNQGEYFFVNQLICFEDMDGLKEAAQLSVRELQSNGLITTSTSVKTTTGFIAGGEKVVRGPIASLSCTTKGDIYEDNMGRCFLVAVDESITQTNKVIQYQNNKAAGLLNDTAELTAKELLQNCIRLLKSYEVVNPYANQIELPKTAHKIRRLNDLYQSFVKQITLLHQYQRKKDENGHLITEKADLEQACTILFDTIILKVDELGGGLRQFFEQLKTYVKSKGQDYEFNRFELREQIGLGKTQQHHYIRELVQLEYIQQKGFANKGYSYKITHWDDMLAFSKKLKNNLNQQLKNLK